MSVFITIEGIEGSGKSTLQRRMAEYLTAKGCAVRLTREPGATVIGREIRNLLLDPRNTALAPAAEVALFAADRAQHVAEVIKPALARGEIVISDRYLHSTLAYQGYGRGYPLPDLEALNTLATGGLQPDLVLLLDLDPASGLARASRRSSEASSGETADEHSWSRFEEEEVAFHERVRQGFLQLAGREKERFVILNALLPAADVAGEACRAIDRLL